MLKKNNFCEDRNLISKNYINEILNKLKAKFTKKIR